MEGPWPTMAANERAMQCVVLKQQKCFFDVACDSSLGYIRYK